MGTEHWLCKQGATQVRERIAGLEGVLVAFSGGIDSSVLLALAHQALGERALAVTLALPAIPEAEIEAARRVAAEIGVAHEVVRLDADPALERNPRDRCYRCKLRLFTHLSALAQARGLAVVLEGSNADDLRAARPGLRAVRELGVLMPLADAGLAKSEVRALGRELGLSNWARPATPCLLTRLPYGALVKSEDLNRIAAAEAALCELGFLVNRVRLHGEFARLELDAPGLERLAASAVRGAVLARLHALGLDHVVVDLEPFVSGSFDRIAEAA